jgi:hypothetical protein
MVDLKCEKYKEIISFLQNEKISKGKIVGYENTENAVDFFLDISSEFEQTYGFNPLGLFTLFQSLCARGIDPAMLLKKNE